MVAWREARVRGTEGAGRRCDAASPRSEYGTPKGPDPRAPPAAELGGHAQKQKNQELQSEIRRNHPLFEKCRMKMTWILPENPKP